MSASGSDAWGILANLWTLIQSVTDESAPALDGIGLSPKAFFVLDCVEHVPFPAELARRAHLPPPTVTYLVKQLEARGYLKRKAEPGDLRKFRLVLTAAGRKAIRQGRQAIADVVADRLSRLDPAEIPALNRVISLLAGGREGRG